MKLSNKIFRFILIPVIAIIAIGCITYTVICSSMPSLLNDFIGRGESHIVTAEGTESWDVNFYDGLTKDNITTKRDGYEVNRKIAEEGCVLLKNNGVFPIAANSTITPFGFAYLNPIYGQSTKSGSAKWQINPTTPDLAMKQAYKVNEASVDRMKAATGTADQTWDQGGLSPAGAEGCLTPATGNSHSYLNEYDPAIYDGITGAENTTGVVFITRTGSEGNDKKYDAYADGTPHYFALSSREMGTIRKAKELCSKVVIILVTSSQMELMPVVQGADEVDGILWIAHPGEKGFDAIPALMTGSANPSGRTVALYSTDFTKDASYNNFGEFKYSNFSEANVWGMSSSKANYIEYQEGVYSNGYRFYETYDLMDPNFVYGELDGKGKVTTKGSVVYPFGYGLSYTTFEQSFASFDASGDNIEVTVNVKNTGNVPGKEVVQIYSSAPYTEFDKTNKIEKPAVVLAGFEKTKLLAAGEQDTVKISFPKEDLASYCYTHENPDNTKGCYVLEDGDYIISLRKNSHDVIDTKTWTNNTLTWYDSDNPRQSEKDAQAARDDEGNILDYPARQKVEPGAKFIAATNHFQECSDYMNEVSHILSRSNWTGTLPTRDEGRTKELPQKYIDMCCLETTFDPETDPLLGNVEGSKVYRSEAPAQGEKNGLSLASMRGVDFYDPAWNDYLDQIDFENEIRQIAKALTVSNYSIFPIESIGLPEIVQADGANGIKDKRNANLGADGRASDAAINSTTTFVYGPLIAATFNKELWHDFGEALAKDAYAIGFNGWYCPAIDLHRSPFSGRNFEYYSEDGLLSGKIASAVISGSTEFGMPCYVKHLAVNDQETNRSSLLHTWADEQTMRENYFRAFEIAIKEPVMKVKYIKDSNGTIGYKTMRASNATMFAMNNIGPTLAHCNYALVTETVRNEWGFVGIGHTDSYIWFGQHNMYDVTLRAGTDTFLTVEMCAGNFIDETSPTAQWCMRNALHRIAYTYANSALMQGVAPGSIVITDIAPWQIIEIVVDIAGAVIVVGLIAWIVIRQIDDDKNPSKYKH